MTQGPTLVTIQPTVGTIPLKVKFAAWLLSRGRGSEYVGFQDQGPLCKRLYSKTLVYNTDRLYSENMQSVVRALGASVHSQIPNLKDHPYFRNLFKRVAWIKGVIWFFIQVLQCLNDLLPLKLRETC